MFIGELEIFPSFLHMNGKDGVFYTRCEDGVFYTRREQPAFYKIKADSLNQCRN